MALISDSEADKPVVVTTPTDDGYAGFYQSLDESEFDPLYWEPILGSGITGIIDHLLNDKDIPLSQRWSDAKITPDLLLGTALKALLDNQTAIDSLNSRLDAFNVENLTPERISSTELRFANGTTSFSIKGTNFETNLFDALEALIDGTAISDATLGNMSGQVGQIILQDTGTDPDVYVSIELKNTDGTSQAALETAEQIAFDIAGFRFQIDGSFPRDVATIHDWSQSGFGIGALIEQENAHVDGIRLIMPEGEILHISTSGITLTIPYESELQPAPANQVRAMQFKLLGEFTNLVQGQNDGETWVDGDLQNTYLSEFSISDVLLNSSDWSVAETVDDIALTMTPTEWKFSLDELSFIVEGTMGNTFADLDRIDSITNDDSGASVVRSLAEIVDRIRITSDILDAQNQNLLLSEYVTDPYYLAGQRLEAGEEVEDFSRLTAGITQLTYSNAIGTNYNDVLFIKYGGSILSGGDGDDDIGQVYQWQDTWIVDGQRNRTIFEGGAGADRFHIPLSPSMYPIEIIDFDPSEGDQIVLIPSYSQVPQISGYSYNTNTGDLTITYDDQDATAIAVALPTGLNENTVLSRVIVDDQLFDLGIIDDQYDHYTNEWHSNASIVYGTRWDDTIRGGDADQTFITFDGSDWIDGGAGADTLILKTSRASDLSISSAVPKIFSQTSVSIETDNVVSILLPSNNDTNHDTQYSFMWREANTVYELLQREHFSNGSRTIVIGQASKSSSGGEPTLTIETIDGGFLLASRDRESQQVAVRKFLVENGVTANGGVEITHAPSPVNVFVGDWWSGSNTPLIAYDSNSGNFALTINADGLPTWIFDAAGELVTSFNAAFTVSNYGTDRADNASIEFLLDGSLVVGYDVGYQTPRNTPPAGAVLTGDESGHATYFNVWDVTSGSVLRNYDYDASPSSYPRTYDAVQINQVTDGDQLAPFIKGLANGNFLVVWQTRDISSGSWESRVSLRTFGADGVPMTAEIELATFTNVPASLSLITVGSKYLVSWTEMTFEGTQSPSYQTFGQFIDAAGMIDGNIFEISNNALSELQENLADESFSALTKYGSSYGAEVENYADFSGLSSSNSLLINVNASDLLRVDNIEKIEFKDGLYSLAADGSLGLLQTYKYLNSIDALLGGSINGSSGSDRIEGLINALRILAGDDDDLLLDSETHDYLAGENGFDRIESDGGADWILGGSGNDEIVLTSDSTYDADLVAANTVLHDLSGRYSHVVKLEGKGRLEKVIDGGADSDTILLSDSADALFLHDTLSSFYDDAELVLTSDFKGNQGTARITNIETIRAGAGDDLIDMTSPDYTNGVGITAYGEAGHDILWGTELADVLYGGDDDDVLFGGAGSDALYGGAGSDRFEFASGSGTDSIDDFNINEDTLVFYARDGLGESTQDATTFTLSNGNQIAWANVSITLDGLNITDQSTLNVVFEVI